MLSVIISFFILVPEEKCQLLDDKNGDMNKTDRQFTYERNIEARSRNHYCSGKAISITYSECVSVALVIQEANRMRRVMLLCGLSEFSIFFPHYFIKGTTFEKKVSEHVF